MSELSPSSPLLGSDAMSPQKTLRRLFLTLFLRGHSARGLKKDAAPKSVGSKLALTLFFYVLFGGLALVFMNQPVFALAVYLHSMTFVFLGLFVASSAGEVLFNKEEADILLHRPIGSRTLLWAKVRVLVEVSLWIAGAFNLVGLFVGFAHDWRFPLVHALSTVLEALFCTGCVVLVYQLCLRWFGRERLEGMMTAAQVVVSVGSVLASQILPQVVFRVHDVISPIGQPWWIALIPPAWFAGLDDALTGGANRESWLLAALALIFTALVLWIAFGKLARDYELGLQAISESGSVRIRKSGRRRWLDLLVGVPPLSWWLRDSVTRSSFLLTAAYLTRDRDVKLRFYPAMAPYVLLPAILLLQGIGRSSQSDGGFSIAFISAYLAPIPMIALSLLRFSQQWQASDVFRSAPMIGPAALCHGARKAVICFVGLPTAVICAAAIFVLHRHGLQMMLLLLPGFITMPVYALLPSLGGVAPLSQPTEAAKSVGRGLGMLVAIGVSIGLAGIAYLAWLYGWFTGFIVAETALAIGLFFAMRHSIDRTGWTSAE